MDYKKARAIAFGVSAAGITNSAEAAIMLLTGNGQITGGDFPVGTPFSISGLFNTDAVDVFPLPTTGLYLDAVTNINLTIGGNAYNFASGSAVVRDNSPDLFGFGDENNTFEAEFTQPGLNNLSSDSLAEALQQDWSQVANQISGTIEGQAVSAVLTPGTVNISSVPEPSALTMAAVAGGIVTAGLGRKISKMFARDQKDTGFSSPSVEI